MSNSSTHWSRKRRLSPVMGEIVLELLRKAYGGKMDDTELVSDRGVTLEEIETAKPVMSRGWKRGKLKPADLPANNRLHSPIRIGRNWLIVPAASGTPSKSKRVSVNIEAAMGFGSGRHETTRLCLQLIEKLLPASSFLDLGTGSGILALAVAEAAFGNTAQRRSPSLDREGIAPLCDAKHGPTPATRVVGLEFDVKALASARANARFNPNGKRIDWVRADVRQWKNRQKFQIIAANLLSGLLMEQASRIVSWLRPEGSVVVSGLLRAQSGEVQEAFEKNGMVLNEKKVLGRWCALLFNRA